MYKINQETFHVFSDSVDIFNLIQTLRIQRNSRLSFFFGDCRGRLRVLPPRPDDHVEV